MQGEEIPFAWPVFASVLQPDSSVCICGFHELKADDGHLGPNYMEMFSTSSGILHLIIMTAFPDI